jgi:hypothetical protein
MASDGAISLTDALSLSLDEYDLVCAEVEQTNRKRAKALKGK